LVGDAHAGLGEREIAFIAVAEIEAFNRTHQLGAGPGSFADNLTIAELDLTQLQVGAQLQVGPTRLEVVQLGKPRSQAHSYNFKGHSILPDVGVFCRILEGGHIQQGDTITILPAN
ncbi:MAG: MOSC domain-containing protein, partial [Anaerolineae bacterium]|nr:MOSC domain-containing protein [Anaerolineae bacterium]